MVVGKEPGYDLFGILVLLHQAVHFVDIYIFKHEKGPHFPKNSKYFYIVQSSMTGMTVQ